MVNFRKSKSKEAKVKHDIDVIETINIELEHKMAKLLKENKTLKRHYKELTDSIKTTKAKTIEHTTSLIAQNAEFKAQLQEKGFVIAALKNELRKLTGNTMNTKFSKSSILGKPVLQPCRNQLVVRQPIAFKSERPRISKPRYASQVDVNNDLPKPVTTHYLPKGKESAYAKPHHMIGLGSSSLSHCLSTLSLVPRSLNLFLVCLKRLCLFAILCLDQHAQTLHLLESLLTISLDRLDILKEDLFEHEHVVMNPTSGGMGYHHHRITCKFMLGFAAALAVLVTGASQSRQHGKSESDSYYLSD
ncbi:hypothetical protein Tco_0115740 [Tanacetum coccineum]